MPARQASTTSRALIGALRVILALTVWSVGHAQPPLATGDEAEVTEDGLHRVDTSTMDAAWVVPDLDLSRYDSVYIRQTGVSFRPAPDSGNRAGQLIERTDFPVPDDLKLELRGVFEQYFHDEFSEIDDMPASAVPGRRVVMAQGFLVNVSTSLPPDEAGTEFIQNLAWQATVVLELRDSMSNDILARTVESERVQELVDSDFVREQIRQLAQRWARLLHTRFDDLVDVAR